MLAGLERSNRNFSMAVVRRADADDVDGRVIDDIVPVGAGFFETEAILGVSRNRRNNVANGVEHRHSRGWPEEFRHVGITNHVGLAHESSADESNF